jgi:hypothetical protein
MTLQEWQKHGWVKQHATSKQEINDLLAVVDRDINDSQSPGLSPEWKLNIAYNAALQGATAALSARGYRPTRDAHHFRIIQSLELTIAADSSLIYQFDGFRKKRNLSEYERTGMVSEAEATEMLELAKNLREDVKAWLRANHPDLINN